MPRLLRNLKNNAVCDFNEGLLENPDYVEMSPAEIAGYITSIRGAPEAVAKLNRGDELVFHMSGRGIGDATSALYTAVGYARAGWRVKFYTPHGEWIRAAEPNLTLMPGTKGGVDCNNGYREHLAAARERGVTRSQWYAEQLATAYDIEYAPPARPATVDIPAPHQDDPCVVLAPFAAHSVREWGITSYVRLALAMRKAGYNVLVMGVKSDMDRARDSFGAVGIRFAVELAPHDAVRMIANAKLFVGNESGLAHVAGLYGTKGLVPLGPTGREWTYDMAPTIQTVSPSTPTCSPCYWQGPELLPICAKQCSAIQTINVFQVIEHATKMIAAHDRKPVEPESVDVKPVDVTPKASTKRKQK